MDAPKDVMTAFNSFFSEWREFLDCNPLYKKELDPFYVVMSFNGLQSTDPPTNMTTLIADYSQTVNVEAPVTVDGSLFLFSFTTLVYANQFDMYIRERLNSPNYRSRVFSSVDMILH